jgi:hypothetical protein
MEPITATHICYAFPHGGLISGHSFFSITLLVQQQSSHPGESAATILSVVVLFPTSGAMRGLNSIMPLIRNDELDQGLYAIEELETYEGGL